MCYDVTSDAADAAEDDVMSDNYCGTESFVCPPAPLIITSHVFTSQEYLHRIIWHRITWHLVT
jgi:hypothetical protein